MNPDGGELSCSNLDSDEDIRFRESDCEESEENADEFDHIPCRTKIAELISYGWIAALQWVPSHVGILSNERIDQKAKQGAESAQPDIPLILRRAKGIISTNIEKYTAMTQKTKSFGRSWETSHCGLNPEAPRESRGCCPLSPNYRT
ncbi:hypothetical protein TNCV_3487491 [Trichonephila clavipes]|nr:hypothetical protein TNCV_3487491 [Trichonephila clavipes]